MKFNKVCLIVLVILFCGNTVASAALNVEKSVTLHLSNRPFSEVAILVSQENEYVVEYDESWKTIPVSGDFVNIPVDSFFRRILKDKNIIIEINDQKRKILVKSFGNKSQKFIVASYLQQNSVTSEALEGIDPMTGKSLSEINAITASQQKKRKEQLQDPKTIDPMTGKTLSELNDTLKKQEMNRVKSLEDLNSVDPISRKTLGEVNRINEIQEKKRITQLADPSTIDPMTGKTISEVNASLESMEKDRKMRLNDPGTIDPVTGKTLAELNAILKQQEANRKKVLAK